jgi:hypothetical protein
MKKLIRIINDWYKESNRDKHSYVGAIIYSTFLVVGFALGVDIIPNAVIASGATIASMMSAEYKDKEYGSPFDWCDILAGMTFPILVDIVCLVIYLIVK